MPVRVYFHSFSPRSRPVVLVCLVSHHLKASMGYKVIGVKRHVCGEEGQLSYSQAECLKRLLYPLTATQACSCFPLTADLGAATWWASLIVNRVSAMARRFHCCHTFVKALQALLCPYPYLENENTDVMDRTSKKTLRREKEMTKHQHFSLLRCFILNMLGLLAFNF